MSLLEWRYLGQVPYLQAWEWQKKLRSLRIQKAVENQLLLLEHPATITLGRLRGEKSLLYPEEVLQQQNVEVIRSDRGGDATLHAPGQMVGYLIVDLIALELRLPLFVERLAEQFVRYIGSFGIEARYNSDYPGVWVGENKVVAFGFHMQRGVTMHGFAFNLHTDLSLFDLIVPCGLQQKGATSLAALLGDSVPTVAEASSAIAMGIAGTLGLEAVLQQGLPLGESDF